MGGYSGYNSNYLSYTLATYHPFMNTFKKHGFIWAMSIFFISSLGLHGLFTWLAHETQEGVLQYTFLRDVFENWQSEFLQLVLQVGLLSILLSVGSPQSKEGQERLEKKLEVVLEYLTPKAAHIIKDIDKQYPKK